MPPAIATGPVVHVDADGTTHSYDRGDYIPDDVAESAKANHHHSMVPVPHGPLHCPDDCASCVPSAAPQSASQATPVAARPAAIATSSSAAPFVSIAAKSEVN